MLEKRRETMMPSSGHAVEPRANAEAPHRTVAGVFGITRITRVLAGNGCQQQNTDAHTWRQSE